MTTPQTPDELKQELFSIVWEWFTENRFYSNWHTTDEKKQWTVDDFILVTPSTSVGSLAMEVSLLVNRLLKESFKAQQAVLLRELLDHRVLFANGSTSGVPATIIEDKLRKFEEKA